MFQLMRNANLMIQISLIQDLAIPIAIYVELRQGKEMIECRHSCW